MTDLLDLGSYQGLMMSDFNTIEFKDDKLILLDQTKLPLEEKYIETDDYERIALAIERLEVRGAPAIGITAAYALAIGMNKSPSKSESDFNRIFNRLAATRPTAVNLFWALERLKNVFSQNINSDIIYNVLLNEAIKIHDGDIKMCHKMGENGLSIFKRKSTVLTHCNTGKLATGGEGTALNVIKYAYKNNLVNYVHADETRPLLQGSRLTAFELSKAGIPFSINTDSTAAFLMQKGEIDLVITGADRIALNGDSANKIGTYNLAVLCKYHNIPFYIAAPSSTIDFNCNTGVEIKIEFRDKSEVNSINELKITSEDYNVYAPAFDVTPNELITGIITENALFTHPYDFSNHK